MAVLVKHNLFNEINFSLCFNLFSFQISSIFLWQEFRYCSYEPPHISLVCSNPYGKNCVQNGFTDNNKTVT